MTSLLRGRLMRFFLGATVLGALLTSCASNRQVRQFDTPPQFLDLQESPSRGTLHYPEGTYAFESEDETGYYYRAPRRVRQHSFGGSYPHEGGIFVLKRDPQRIRGYIVLYGERRKMGNLSGTRHSFR
ncbi:MAG TPA: hypothetical protein VK993_03725 [Chthoniobacterales bacterium]|nr:hypothetical protein [Chthoniobacterales bacterium]